MTLPSIPAMIPYTEGSVPFTWGGGACLAPFMVVGACCLASCLMEGELPSADLWRWVVGLEECLFDLLGGGVVAFFIRLMPLCSGRTPCLSPALLCMPYRFPQFRERGNMPATLHTATSLHLFLPTVPPLHSVPTIDVEYFVCSYPAAVHMTFHLLGWRRRECLCWGGTCLPCLPHLPAYYDAYHCHLPTTCLPFVDHLEGRKSTHLFVLLPSSSVDF